LVFQKKKQKTRGNGDGVNNYVVYRKILESGHLDVGAGHKLYYELCGNSNGPLMVQNKGGPGGTLKDKDKKCYNLKKYQVLFYDQRGCGRSTFKQLLKHNTTQHLVDDVKKLIEHVNQSKAIITGGSWGSTISLLFAITYPEMTKELRLSGIYLGTKKESDFRINLKTYYPQVHGFLEGIYGDNYLRAIWSRVLSSKDATAAKHMEISECALMTYLFDFKKAIKTEVTYENSHKIFAHYLSNDCFLPSNYILKNLHNIKSIKTSIVHGTHDLLCLPIVAQTVAGKLDNCKLHFVVGSHYEDKGDTSSQLMKKIMKEYAR